MEITYAQCPYCKLWFPVCWDDSVPPGGWWWVNSGCCPGCDNPVCVETECEFTKIKCDRRFVIVRNRAQCLVCNEIIESENRHNFVTCRCGNLSVDGGHDYLKRTFASDKWKELSEEKQD